MEGLYLGETSDPSEATKVESLLNTMMSSPERTEEVWEGITPNISEELQRRLQVYTYHWYSCFISTEC